LTAGRTENRGICRVAKSQLNDLAAGMDGYIAKHIQAEALIDALKNLGQPPAAVEGATTAKRQG